MRDVGKNSETAAERREAGRVLWWFADAGEGIGGKKAGALAERVDEDLGEGVLTEVPCVSGRKTGASAERTDVTEVLGMSASVK